jgi:hypothetical protein
MRSAAVLAFTGIACACACVGAGAGADIEAPRLLGTDPPHAASGVSPLTTVAARFSEPLSADAARSAWGAVLVEGIPTGALLSDLEHPPVARPGLVECDRELPGENAILFRPRAALRGRATYSVVFTRSLRDRAGNRLWGAPVVASFTTGDAPVRLVVPEGLAPPNLAAVVVEAQTPFQGTLRPEALRIEDPSGTPVAALPLEAYGDPRLRGLRLLAPLQSGGHRVRVRAPPGESVLHFEVGERPDVQPPSFARLQAEPFGDTLRILVALDEPAWLRLWTGDAPDRLAGGAWTTFGAEERLTVTGLGIGQRIFARVEARDAAGLTSVAPPPAEPPLEAQIHPFLRVEINEIVTDAQRDWSDGECRCAPPVWCGVPFDANPGCDVRLGPADEWVELANRSGETIDLAAGPQAWRLRVRDDTPEITVLAEGRGALVFSPGSHFRAWRSGDFLVVKPSGNSNNDAQLELVDAWGSVVDRVTLGQAGVPTGRSSGPDDEAVARVEGSGRWCRMRASPGAANSGRCAGE